MTKIKESVVETYLTREVEKRGGLCVKEIAVGRAGWPDRTIYGISTVPFKVECKRPGESLEAKQIYWFKKLTKLSIDCFLVQSVEDVDNLLKTYD